MAFLLVNPQPRKRALVFIAGAVIATLGFGFALVFVLQGTGVERSPHHRTVPAWVDLGIGILLLGSAIYVWFRPPKGPKAAKQRRELGLVGLLVTGLLMYTRTPLYLAALHSARSSCSRPAPSASTSSSRRPSTSSRARPPIPPPPPT